MRLYIASELINDALRRTVEGEHLQANLRTLIREEFGRVSRTKQPSS